MNAQIIHIKGDPKCRRVHQNKLCGARKSQHADGKCPDNPGTFTGQNASKTRVSLSMNEDAVDAAHHVVKGLLAGKQASEMRDHVGFKDFAKVVLATAQRMREQQKTGAR